MNVTNSLANCTYENLFPSQSSNFQQHQFKLGKSFAFFTNAALWLTLFSRMNASHMDVEMNSLISDAFDVSPYFYIQGEPDHISVYPLKMEQHLIMAPEALPYSDFTSYLIAVSSNEFLGYSVITVAVIVLLLIIIRYIKQKRILLLQSAADVSNLLMNDNFVIKYQQLSRSELFLIIPITFVGLVIVNGTLSTLKSYLIRPIDQPQMNTPEDIYRSQLHILTWHET